MGKFNFKGNDDFEKVCADAEALYATFGKIRCPYFGELIACNAAGLKHLRFKANRVARPRTDQYARLKLLKFIPHVLSLSRTVQGIWETRCFERIRMHSRTDAILKPVIYHEFIAVIESVRVKVIVKEIDGSEKFFWSIIPYWGTDKINSRRVLRGGDPEND